MRSADQVRLELLADLAHDLRTPLTSARGYAKMLLEEKVGALSSIQQEYLGIIVQSMNRMIPLLNDLASLATAESLSFEPLDLADLWHDSLELWKTHAQIKSIQIREMVPAESLLIRGDRQKLKQAFEELLSRMVRSTEPGDEIVIELLYEGGEAAAVSISGGPADNPKAADSLNPSRSESKSDQPEMDMGLTLVQRIIRLHGGQMSIEKNARGGSIFALTLPV